MDDQYTKLVFRYVKELNKIMKKTGDHETVRYEKAVDKEIQ